MYTFFLRFIFISRGTKLPIGPDDNLPATQQPRSKDLIPKIFIYFSFCPEIVENDDIAEIQEIQEVKQDKDNKEEVKEVKEVKEGRPEEASEEKTEKVGNFTSTLLTKVSSFLYMSYDFTH